MNFLKIAAAFVIAASPALGAGYSGHNGVRLFTEYPCTAAIQAIEAEFDIEDQIAVLGISAAMDELASHVARQGMAWGFVIGYDTALGGLAKNDETTFARFKASCGESPDATGFDVLQSLQ